MSRMLTALPLLGLLTVAALAEPPRILAGPMFSLTSGEDITLWVQVDQPADLSCTWRAEDDRVVIEQERVAPSVPERNIYVATLSASARRMADTSRWTAELRVTTGTRDEGSAVTVSRSTTMTLRLPVPRGYAGVSGGRRIAFGSCSHQDRFASQPIWTRVLKTRPHQFLFIGDNIYLPGRADSYPDDRDGVLRLYRDTYDQNRQLPELQRLLRSTLCSALWDDHDFGPNNSDRTWKWADVALQTLNEYFPNQYGTPEARGCFHTTRTGAVQTFMLDNRAFRDGNKDPQRRTFLGDVQLAWLKEGLRTSDAPVKLVVAGNQILADTHPHESWGNQFRAERDAFLNWIWNERIEGVIFLSGDRHFAELARKEDPTGRGNTLWELTSSPLANSHYEKGAEIAYPDRVAAYNDGVNFGLVEISGLTRPRTVTLSIIDVRGERVITQQVMGPTNPQP